MALGDSVANGASGTPGRISEYLDLTAVIGALLWWTFISLDSRGNNMESTTNNQNNNTAQGPKGNQGGTEGPKGTSKPSKQLGEGSGSSGTGETSDKKLIDGVEKLAIRGKQLSSKSRNWP